jgi:membrane protein implicated in regulation of membrane protease activity
MSWQYRKSKKVGPFRFTASKRGISTSVGFGPLRMTRRADGGYQRTVRIPGTGLRTTTRLSSPRQQPQSGLLGGAVGFGVGFMLARLLFLPLLIVGILFLWFATWRALLVWGLIITAIIAIILTRRYMRHRQAPDGNQLAQSVCQILDAGVTANGTLNIKDALNAVLDANPNIKGADAADFVGGFIGEVIGTYRPQYAPLVPPNVGAIAEEAFRERVFLNTLVKVGVNIRQPIDQAHTVCQVLDTGVTFEQMSWRVAKLNDIPPLDAARFVGTAIAAYCPHHNSLMEEQPKQEGPRK